MRIIHAVPDEEDLKRFKQAAEDLSNSDPETRKKFWTEVGLYDEDGNIAEPFRDLFPEKD
ncbi:MAG: hypothetical protein FWG58_03060 [Methanomassiliicoccaceae archaeon]|nr:hypothetical protein [Methanomassiliicoccaceae archaeon]